MDKLLMTRISRRVLAEQHIAFHRRACSPPSLPAVHARPDTRTLCAERARGDGGTHGYEYWVKPRGTRLGISKGGKGAVRLPKIIATLA